MWSSVMGLLVSSPSLTHHAAGLGLLFVVDVTPPLHAIRQTERANLGCTRSRLLSAQHPHVRLYSIQRPCDGTSFRRASGPPLFLLTRLGLGGSRSRHLAPAEIGAVYPHAMQHHRQFASQRDLRPLHPAQLRDAQRPGL